MSEVIEVQQGIHKLQKYVSFETSSVVFVDWHTVGSIVDGNNNDILICGKACTIISKQRIGPKGQTTLNFGQQVYEMCWPNV